MRWQTTAVLAVLLVALGAFYYVYEIRLAPDREKAESAKGRLWKVETADVTTMQLRRPDGVVQVTREGDGWQLVEPVKARGDRGPIDEALTAIATARVDREVASAPANLADFGLDTPKAEVILTLKDGKTLELQLGEKNPTGVWVYAREKDRPAVFLVSEGLIRDATRPAADFRDKTVLTFDRGALTGLEIVTRDDTLDLQLTDGKWALTRPVARPADAETVNGLLEKLQTARVKEFVAESPRSLELYGLERPVRLTLHTGQDKDRTSRSLLLGKTDDQKKGVYAMRPGEPTVLLLPDDVWNSLPRTVAAVRDRTVVAFDRERVTTLELESPRGRMTLARQDGRWTITAPEALPADQVEAGALLTKLHDLRARGFVSEDAAGISRFLGRPEVTVTVTEQGAATPLRILLAPSGESRGGQPTAYAAVAGRGPVVLVDGRAVADLSRSVVDLRDRTLLGGLEPRDIRRVRVRSGDRTVVLERKGETDWTILEPTQASARPNRVDDLLYTLRSLRWKDIASPRGEDPARYGLATPDLEITLYRADGTEIATVLVGKREGEAMFVKTRAAPAIYTVDARSLDSLPKSLEDFKS
jgi:hypothetical protein